jgi:hypothetical protein
MGAAGFSPSGGGTAFTHGNQITRNNVGYEAYYDEALGRTLLLSDLTEISGTHWVSDFVAPGGTVYSTHFTGNVTIDNVHFAGCLFDAGVGGYLNGSSAAGWTLTYCTVSPPAPGDQTLYYEAYTATRCVLEGCSDGVKANGNNTTIIEC